MKLYCFTGLYTKQNHAQREKVESSYNYQDHLKFNYPDKLQILIL